MSKYQERPLKLRLLMGGIVVGVGQAVGPRIRAKMVIKKGTGFIRPILITAVLAVTVKLFYDTW